MFDLDETIEAFRRCALDLDCKRMVLSQRKEGGDRFEGQGYIRQSPDGTPIFKIYVAQHNAEPFDDLRAALGAKAGELQGEEIFHDLDATAFDGTRWTATRIVRAPNWDATDRSVILNGQAQSIIAHLNMPQRSPYLCLHFFEEYELPLDRMSEAEMHGSRYMVRDRAEFEACGSKFEVRKRDGSGDTVIEATSETSFPAAFNVRVQEALQYVTAKTAIWRARVESAGDELQLELASPWRKSSRTQFSPPISPASTDFLKHGWELFEKYLAYVVANTRDTYWNSVAYHLYNACEATSGSVDAWAAGVSVAVEAVASLISVERDQTKSKQIASAQARMHEWLAEQVDFPGDLVRRIKGQINGMNTKRPQDTLYALAETGHVERDYIKAWSDLRNRHVHPKLKDLKKPNPVEYQRLFDQIHRAEVLLRQLTFYLIGYEGPFTDYGIHGGQVFVSKQYPLKIA